MRKLGLSPANRLAEVEDTVPMAPKAPPFSRDGCQEKCFVALHPFPGEKSHSIYRTGAVDWMGSDLDVMDDTNPRLEKPRKGYFPKGEASL